VDLDDNYPVICGSKTFIAIAFPNLAIFDREKCDLIKMFLRKGKIFLNLLDSQDLPGHLNLRSLQILFLLKRGFLCLIL
jgi:hypothetical protein